MAGAIVVFIEDIPDEKQLTIHCSARLMENLDALPVEEPTFYEIFVGLIEDITPQRTPVITLEEQFL
jgi:hypothetical protein